MFATHSTDKGPIFSIYMKGSYKQTRQENGQRAQTDNHRKGTVKEIRMHKDMFILIHNTKKAP